MSVSYTHLDHIHIVEPLSCDKAPPKTIFWEIAPGLSRRVDQPFAVREDLA